MEVKDEEISSLEKGEDFLENIRVSPIGYNGLQVSAGDVQESCESELRFPRSIKIYNKMLTDGAVGPACEYVQMIIQNVSWDVVAPKGYEEELKDKIQYVKTTTTDMEHSWLSFLKQASSFIPLGFAPFEVVPRRRLKEKGSKYNDGLWGVRKLALRSQDTISGVEYKNKGRDFKGFWQRVNIPSNRYETRLVYSNKNEILGSDVLIPVERLINFRNNPVKDNPYGKSPLDAVYMSWRYKKAYEENLAHGIAQDVHGLKVLELPPEIMKEDAKPAEKAVYDMYKRIMRDVHIGKESGVILPRAFTQGGQEQFKFHVVSTTGSKSYNVLEVINHYNREILTGLYAEFLTIGQGGGGSNALAESKSTTVQQVVESKLSEIQDVLNHQLIPMLFRWNGWEMEVLPEFKFGEVSIVDLETFSKAIQRIGAVKLIPRTAKNVNAIAERLNLPDRIREEATREEIDEILGSPPPETRSGEGMESGMPGGTGDATGSSGDSSTSNSENA